MFRWLNQDEEVQAPPASEPTADFSRKALGLMDALGVVTRKASNQLPSVSYSHLRRIDDTLRVLILNAPDNFFTAEQQYTIESFINDYVPSTINAYLGIRDKDRQPGSDNEKMFIEQCRALHAAAFRMQERMHKEAVMRLKTQAAFLRDRLQAGDI